MVKPGRPLGLSIAIFVSVMLFSILPVAQVVFVMSLQQQFANIDFMEQGGAVGGELQIGNISLIVPAVMGILFFVVAVLAWRGRPHAIRFIFMLAVIFVTVVTIVLTAVAVSTPASLEQGLDSGGDFSNSLLMTRAVFSILVALYVSWYVNRGPARAFYRGYYLPESDDQPLQAGETARTSS